MTTAALWTAIRPVRAVRARLLASGRTRRTTLAREIDTRAIPALTRDWLIHGRDDQLPPPAARDGSAWTRWLLMGGRGAGKTRAGAEWVRGMALGLAPHAAVPVGRLALVGATYADAREVMVEGPSGLLGIHGAHERPAWCPSRRRLTWPNGAVALVFSADEPESLRGPQFEGAWLDELARYPRAASTWTNLGLGLRLGVRPRLLATTTPRATPLLRGLLADERLALTRAPTRANAGNLAGGFLAEMEAAHAGTALGRQELEGELVEEVPGALWTRGLIEAARVALAPPLVRVVVAVDPPASSRTGADACGIVAVGTCAGGVAYVLADGTVSGQRPHGWASAAARLARLHEAGAIVVEVNQGGEMAEAVLREAEPDLPVRPVRAGKAKRARAEPVAALYERGRVRHAGVFVALEDEMAGFGPREGGGFGLPGGRSPDRLDALVWGVTHLLLEGAGEPRVRGL